MNWQIILGLVLIGGGTALTLVGGRRLSQRDSEPLEKKVEQVLERIENARSTETSASSQDSLDRIEEEFLLWAKSLKGDLGSRKLEVQQARLQSIDKQLSLSRTIRPVFAEVLSVLRKCIDAYIAEGGKDISFSLNEVPENLFDPNQSLSIGQVKFGDVVIWNIGVRRTVTFSTTSGAILDFDISNPNKVSPQAGETSWFAVSVDTVTRKVKTMLAGTQLPQADGLNIDVDLENYQTSLKAALKKLIEVQLAMVDIYKP